MIICFSGTGNSRRVADRLQEMLGDEMLRLPPGQMIKPSRVSIHVTDSRLIWVFPVHAWGLPSTVRNVIDNVDIKTNDDQPVLHHMVVTCGDDIGYCDKEWCDHISKRKWLPGNMFSVQMPNVYVFFPGFDVDKEEVAAAKLEAMEERVKLIAPKLVTMEQADSKESSLGVADVVRGSMPWIKSKVLLPLFHRFLTTTKHFKSTNDCNGCAKCARNCPLVTISIKEGRPQWDKQCNMCSRCYQICPNHAIKYGPFTKKKGQYLCPGYNIKN